VSGLPIGKPSRVRSGDLVGVVAPSGAVDGERLASGVRALESLGWRVMVGTAALSRRSYLAGTDEERRADLQRMIDDPSVRAIFCARGGYGSQRIVPNLDLAELVRAPKPIIGFSDVTAVLSAVVTAGVVAFHGPMVAVDVARGLSASAAEHLIRAISDPGYLWDVRVPVSVRPGSASGRLVGGNLSVLVTTLGTRWALDTDGTVLFLEDVHEWPYRLDRLLTQLRQAGRLDGVAGVVFGTMATCRGDAGIGPLEVVRDFFADAPYPVGFGVPSGHDDASSDIENLALPFGVSVSLDVDRGRLTALEGAVV
jgi:muramoyltetrapeptide carboxypeptidase